MFKVPRGPHVLGMLVAFSLASIPTPGETVAANGTMTPNVVLILADDMGYGEIRSLNPERAKIPTPSLDALVSQGRVFTEAHSSSSVCTPTRYALLTGRYNWRTRLQSGVMTGGGEPLIAADRMTLGHLFGKQGYRTAIIGKWHLNYNYDIPESLADVPRSKKTKTRYPAPVPIGTIIPDGPLTRGFDFFRGFHHAREMSSFVNDDTITEEIDIDEVLPRLESEAVQYIRQNAAAAEHGQPFFLYFPLSAPHTPIVPTRDWTGKGKIGKYADFVAQTDGVVGAVMRALEQSGISNETLIIFAADNGTSKAAGIDKLNTKGHYPSAERRGSKADLWDGGHRIPFIARWPGKVPAGTRTDQLICLSDFMATFAEMFGLTFDERTAEDSESFLPGLLGEPSSSTRQTIIHHSISGHFSIRVGDWKLLLASGSGGWSQPKEAEARRRGLPHAQLYRMGDDPGETRNLLNAHPERVSSMLAGLKQIVDRGRSTPGPVQSNDVEIDLWKRGNVK